jgi:hypothetical protein
MTRARAAIKKMTKLALEGHQVFIAQYQLLSLVHWRYALFLLAVGKKGGASREKCVVQHK